MVISLKFKVANYQRGVRESRQLFTREALRGGPIDPSQIIDSYLNANRALFDVRKDFKFCPHCGQQTNDELTVALLFYNTITNYFSFDARFIKSIVPLLFKPGYLPKVFIEVKRSIYLHPGQLYLFISVLFFFLTNDFPNSEVPEP